MEPVMTSGYLFPTRDSSSVQDGELMSLSEGPRHRVLEMSLGGFSNNNNLDDTDILTSFGASQVAVPKIGEVAGVSMASKLLGKGTYSEVWQCKVQGFEEFLAVKVLATDVLSGAGSKEARILKGLKHPNLVQLIDILEGPPCALVLELCKGKTLNEFLYGPHTRASTGFTPQQRLKPLLEVACAITYLHGMEILHRDVKPTNVFFTDLSWQSTNELPGVKLGDLGLARAVDESAHMSKGVGTLPYMAPENLGHNHYGKPADVYSIAILANELATCERPYAHNVAAKMNFAGVALFILEGGRPRLCEGHVGTNMIVDCWSAQPEQRWPAETIVQFLQAFF